MDGKATWLKAIQLFQTSNLNVWRNLVIRHCYFADDGYEMCQDLKRTCRGNAGDVLAGDVSR